MSHWDFLPEQKKKKSQSLVLLHGNPQHDTVTATLIHEAGIASSSTSCQMCYLNVFFYLVMSSNSFWILINHRIIQQIPFKSFYYNEIHNTTELQCIQRRYVAI